MIVKKRKKEREKRRKIISDKRIEGERWEESEVMGKAKTALRKRKREERKTEEK